MPHSLNAGGYIKYRTEMLKKTGYLIEKAGEKATPAFKYYNYGRLTKPIAS